MEKPNNPCQHCNYHTWDCHTNCFKYKEFEQLNELYKNELRKERFNTYQNMSNYKRSKKNKYEHDKNRGKRI